MNSINISGLKTGRKRTKKLKFLFLFLIITAVSLGCIESQKPISTPGPTPEQKLPVYNKTEPLIKNDTFETWSRGYFASYYDTHPFFKVMINYSLWIAFLNEQGTFLDEYGYFAWLRKTPGSSYERIEGTLFPGPGILPKTIESSDFNNYFIIAAMMGYKSKLKPEIEITNISRTNNVINVTVRMYEPSYGEAVMSSPYHIVIVKRELLPKGNAIFNFINTENKNLGEVGVNG